MTRAAINKADVATIRARLRGGPAPAFRYRDFGNLATIGITAASNMERGGRGILGRRIHINSESGRLADTDFALTDRAAGICPVGVILKKRKGFAVPIGERRYDKSPISAQVKETTS